MVRSRGDGIRALWYHPCFGHVAHDLCARQMSADTGLGALAHFDLDGRAGVQVCLIDAETAGGHLYDSVGAVGIEIPVQSALAGVVADAQLPGSLGQRRMGVVADGAIAHSRKQNGHRQLQLRRYLGAQAAVPVPPDGLRLLAQEYPRLHGLPQGVDGWVRHL